MQQHIDKETGAITFTLTFTEKGIQKILVNLTELQQEVSCMHQEIIDLKTQLEERKE